MKTINYEIKNILDEINKRSAISQEDISELADNTIKLFKGKHGGGGERIRKRKSEASANCGKISSGFNRGVLEVPKGGRGRKYI